MAGNRSSRNVQTSPVGSPTSGNISDGNSKEQDRFLPIANVSRIMKKSLPANAKISKEAKETVQECVSEFISFITGEASDKCQREKRKTINGDDLLWAMTTLGFENYVGPLKVYLNRYRETEGEKNLASGNNGANICASGHEDHDQVTPVTNSNNSDSYGALGSEFMMRKVVHGGSHTSGGDLLLLRGHSQGFNGGFYSLGEQGIGGVGYGEGNLMMGGGFDLNRRLSGNGGENGSNGAIAAQVHQGVGW